MNILHVNPFFQQIKTNKFSNYQSINRDLLVSKDTVSFGAGANVRKIIEEFKKKDPAGNYDIKTNDVLKIYEYFGFKMAQNGTSHAKFVGPYGQVASFAVNKQTVNAGTASDLIRALKRADDFDGELIIVEGEISPEQIAHWKDVIATRQPNADQINNYALDLQTKRKQLQQEQDVQQPSVNKAKDIEKKIANAKIKINILSTQVQNSANAIDELYKDVESLRDLAKGAKIVEIEKDVESLLQDISKLKEQVNEDSQTVNGFSKQLNNGYPLSKENESQIEDLSTNDYGVTSLKTRFEELVEQMDKVQEQKKILASELSEAVLDIQIFTEDVIAELQRMTTKIEDPSVRALLSRTKVQPIENLIKEIKKDIKAKLKHASKYEDVNVDLYTSEQLEKIKVSLISDLKVNDDNNDRLNKTFAEQINSKLNNLRNLYKNIIGPLDDVSGAESKRSKSMQIEKFQKRYGHLKKDKQERIDRIDDADKPRKADDKHHARPELEVIVDQEGKEVHSRPITPKGSVRDEKRSEIQNQQKVTVQTTQTNNKFNSLSPIKKDMISKLAPKIAPLRLPAILNAMTNLLAENFDFQSFETIRSDNNVIREFVSKQIHKLSTNSEYLKIKNASKFALLFELSKNISKPCPEIYDLNSNELSQLFEKLRTGKSQVSFVHQGSGKEITLELRNGIRENNVNSKFEDFNTVIFEKQKNKVWSDTIGKGLADEILKYVETKSENELHSLIIAIGKEGSYLELVNEPEADDLLKLNVLKTFLSKFDSDNGAQCCDKATKLFEENIKKQNLEKLQQQKLESIDNVDWSL